MERELTCFGQGLTVKAQTIQSAVNWGSTEKPDWYIEFTDSNGHAFYVKQQYDGIAVIFHDTVTVYAILPYFDSYMRDVKNNICQDPQTYARFRKDEKPFASDVLLDFGDFSHWVPGKMLPASEREAIDFILELAIRKHYRD